MKDAAQMVAEKILGLLDKGVSPWHASWNCGMAGMPRNAYGKEYRGVNVILLGLKGRKSPWWFTFRKAKELGGNVRKGERGTTVVFNKHTQFIERGEDGEAIVGDDGVPRLRSFFLARCFTVFNAEQIDGLPDKYKGAAEGAWENDVVPHEAAAGIWALYEDAPKVSHHDCFYPSYSPTRDEITIPEPKRFKSTEEYYATLFHEGCHSTGHKKRLDRDMGGGFGSDKYAFEELVAEIGAQMLCQRCGIERTLDSGASYCKGWARKLRGEKNVGKAILRAASLAQRAADYILGVKFADDNDNENNKEEK